LAANHQNWGVTMREAYCGAYKVDRMGDPLREDIVSINKSDEMRVGRIMKKIGLEKKHLMMGNKWFPGERFDRNYSLPIQKTIHEEEY